MDSTSDHLDALGQSGAVGQSFSLAAPRRIHIVGIGGVGMSAIATVLAEMGHVVTGSDLKESPVLERLRSAGATVKVGHDRHNVSGCEVVAISSAISQSNLEVLAANELGIPILSRAELLASIVATKQSIAVAGTHGKTTTTSMLAQILVQADWRPCFIVGGELNEVGGGAAWDAGDWLVVEADESDGTFLELFPDVAVVTNIEADHLEHYGTFDDLVEAFRNYLSSVPKVVAWADDKILGPLAMEAHAVTVGRGQGLDFTVEEISRNRDGSRFALHKANKNLGEIHLAVPGSHNVANAALAAAVAVELGVEFPAIQSGLGSFAGVARRFQFRLKLAGVQIVDDYAHLPGEVWPVLQAASEGGWERVVAVFQPHRYSRTNALWADFANAFSYADVICVTDVYAAGEAPMPGVTGQLVADAVASAEPDKQVHYLPGRADLAKNLASILRSGDVCMLLGAGDVGAVADELRKWLK